MDGETTDAGISDKFMNIYNNLYNSINDINFINIRQNVEELVRTECNTGKCKSANCHEISSDTVRKAVDKLQSNKNDEIYGITTDNFINATDIVFEKLGQLIRFMIRQELASEIINTS